MQSRSKVALIFFAALVAAALFLQTPLLRTVRSAAWTGWLFSIARLFDIGPLQPEQSLMNRLTELTATNLRLQAELKDYQQLKDQIGSVTYQSLRPIPAAIIGRPLDTFRSQLTINQGSRAGVTPGAPVVVHGSVLIGFVDDVFTNSATIQLLLHPTTSLSAEVVSEAAPRGLVVGRHYTTLAITTIPQDATLQAGQAVVSVSREGLPHGLLIGSITSVNREENEAYQEANVTLPYDPDRLRAVTILVLP